MPDRRTRLPLNRVTMAWAEEAEAMGVPASTLIVTDLVRLRAVLQANEPALTRWEWDLVSHVVPSEGMALIADLGAGQAIVSGSVIACAILEWADGANDADLLAAERLAARARKWTDLERWAVMVRARAR